MIILIRGKVMDNSEIHRCKRCEKWVFDDSPMCPFCTKRHNEVYNHFNPKNDVQYKSQTTIKDSWLYKVILGLVFGGILFLGISFYYKHLYINIESFPDNYTVFNVNNEAYYQTELGLIEIETIDLFGYIITLEDIENGSNIISFFMYPNSKMKLEIPVGSYRINYSVGKKWDSDYNNFSSLNNSFRSEFIYFITVNNSTYFTLYSNGKVFYKVTN